MKPDVCIYHAPCQDGFTAAWAIWKRWPDTLFVPAKYGDAPPDVAGQRVLIVDFSYKAPVLEAMGAAAEWVVVLDHHKSAQADLAVFARGIPPGSGGLSEEAARARGDGGLPIAALFDMEKSGAMLAWEYAHPGEPAPLIVRTVQDRDLWRFELEDTREIAACLFSTDYDFDAWDIAAQRLEQADGCVDFVLEGAAIERKHHKDVGELIDQTLRSMLIGGHWVPVANLPYTMASDAANQLADGNPFAACYYDAGNGDRVFSLRSHAGGVDVSEIAAGYGGGGHARAAGFRAPLGWEGDR